ncbi:uncharacterized protein NPIL_34021 [Nephila pilipes]|uniref:Uncharacterized protein n=1 Tax=Nephila pilipes TaxID=299642 RepID=A0A8X6P361_NEPPI|nr:uncharacterized protein NPIL_34021 [Nephila pilipes]
MLSPTGKRPYPGPPLGYLGWWQEVKMTTRNYSKHSYSSHYGSVNVIQGGPALSFFFLVISPNATNAYDILVDLIQLCQSSFSVNPLPKWLKICLDTRGFERIRVTLNLQRGCPNGVPTYEDHQFQVRGTPWFSKKRGVPGGGSLQWRFRGLFISPVDFHPLAFDSRGVAGKRQNRMFESSVDILADFVEKSPSKKKWQLRDTTVFHLRLEVCDGAHLTKGRVEFFRVDENMEICIVPNPTPFIYMAMMSEKIKPNGQILKDIVARI